MSQQKTILMELNKQAPEVWDISNIDREAILGSFTYWMEVTYDPLVVNSLSNHFLLVAAIKSLEDEI